MRVRPYLALAMLAIAAALWLGAPGASAGSGTARHGTAAACGKPARANGHQSLARWARRHHSTVREVLTVTYTCGGGFSLALDFYLSGNNLRHVMPRGVPLWTLGRKTWWRQAVAATHAFCSRGAC